MLREWLSRLHATTRRDQLEHEFDDEVHAHLEQLRDRFIRQGMHPADALNAARRQFGGVTQVRENQRERRALPPIDILFQDLRHAARQLRHAPSFSASVVLTLALGIGATTAVFAVLDAVVLKPLPYADPARLVSVRSITQRPTPHSQEVSYPNFFDFRSRNQVFEHLVSYCHARFTLTEAGAPLRLSAEVVSWDLFPMLGVQPILGRGFTPEEERPGTNVAVVGYELWKDRFHGDPSLVGRTIRLDGTPFVVDGIAPPGFHFPMDDPEAQVWTTLAQHSKTSEFHPLSEQRGSYVLDLTARLKSGVAVAQANAQMDVIAASLARQYPDTNETITTTTLQPELEHYAGPSRTPLWTLLGAVSLVLLIACANVANLLLSRSTTRAREFSLRSALGASRRALVRQLLFESLALGIAGAAGGVLLALGALKLVLPLAADALPRLSQAAIDGRVLAFAAALAGFTSVLFSMAPAIRVAQSNLTGALKEGAANIARGGNPMRNALVITQIALGLVLIVGAELLMASFLHLLHQDAGFRSDHLLTFAIGLPSYDAPAEVSFTDRFLDRLRSIPGVQAAATGQPLPLAGSQMEVSFDIEIHPTANATRPISRIAIVTPGFLGVLGIPLLRGRSFTDRDGPTSPRVLIVNEAFAQKFFPGEDPLGKRIKPGAYNGKGDSSQMREIVGVVGNARQSALTPEPVPMYYFPYRQLSWGIGTIALRTSVPPLEVESAVRATLKSLEPDAPMYRVRTGEEMTMVAIAEPRFQTILMGAFAAVALILTMTGLYGVLSYAVARRRREIGVRIALGASHRAVLGSVLREATLLVIAGLALGLTGAAALTRLLSTMIYGVRPTDPIVILSACSLIALTSFAAAYLPANRAASLDPMQILRSE